MPKMGAKKSLKTPQNGGPKRALKGGVKTPGGTRGALGGTQDFSGKVLQNSGKVLCFNVKNLRKIS